MDTALAAVIITVIGGAIAAALPISIRYALSSSKNSGPTDAEWALYADKVARLETNQMKMIERHEKLRDSVLQYFRDNSSIDSRLRKPPGITDTWDPGNNP